MDTDYFVVDVDGREIEIGQGRTQYYNVYSMCVDDVQIKIKDKIDGDKTILEIGDETYKCISLYQAWKAARSIIVTDLTP